MSKQKQVRFKHSEICLMLELLKRHYTKNETLINKLEHYKRTSKEVLAEMNDNSK